MMSGVGRNIEDALRSIELQNSRQLSTVYLTFVVLGEEFAKRDVSSVIDVFSRHLHYKPSTLVMVCRDSANQFLSGIQSQEEIEPSQALLKLITTGNEDLSGCPLVTMHDFMVAYNTQTSSPMAPYVGLASPVSAEQESEEGPEEKPGKSQDGGSDGGGSKSSGKVARVLGTALFTNVDSACLMAGTLDTFETMGALMLANELTSGLIEFSYPGDQAESTMLIHHVDSFIDLSLGRDEIEVRFRVVLTASLSESAVSGDLPEKEQEFRKGVARTVEQQIHALLHKTFEKITAADSDILGLARSAQTKFATHGEWEEFDWPSRFAGIKATIDVKVHLLTYGFILEKPAPR